jgi:hypothetical protein
LQLGAELVPLEDVLIGDEEQQQDSWAPLQRHAAVLA